MLSWIETEMNIEIWERKVVKFECLLKNNTESSLI